MELKGLQDAFTGRPDASGDFYITHDETDGEQVWAEARDAVEDAVAKHRGSYDRIYVVYADCGTGGLLDPVLEEFSVERLPGPHCYAFFAGQDALQPDPHERLVVDQQHPFHE